jgi:hypothetical protein
MIREIIRLGLCVLPISGHFLRNSVLNLPSNITIDPLQSVQNININLTDPMCIQVSIGEKTFWCVPKLPPIQTSWSYDCNDTEPISL